MVDGAIEDAVRVLRAGGVVGVPTETVYGVAGDARNPEAIARLFALKGRPDGRPLPVLLPDVDALVRLCPDLPDAARVLGAAFWPGPLTLVVPRPPGLPDALTAGGDTLGVRVPRHPVALALLQAFGGALATPSANRHGEVSATDAESARAAFGGDLGLVLDGGASAVGVESTVIDLTQDPPRLLRAGALSAEAIEEVLGRPLTASENPGGSTAFSPKTPTEIVGEGDLMARCEAFGREGARVVVLAPRGTRLPAGVRHLELPDDEAERARGFYARLREADALRLDHLLVADPGSSAWGAAIRQRLRGVSA